MRYKVILAYDGRNYAGFQSQKNATAIQDIVEGAIERVFSEKIRIIMSSRTDAGVHAYGQVFHFDTDKEKDEGKLKFSLNSLLPDDIHVVEVKKVSRDFHARYSVKKKTYEYLINLGEYDVFLKGRAFQCFYKLDVDLMKEGAKLFLGEHDFSSFNTSSLKEYPNQVRNITEFSITRKKDILKIRVTSSGFLRNMVRIMVGTLIDLGRGKKSLDDIKDMLEHPCKSTRRYNADPNGLYLVKIFY
ncbi:MAG: tRNA pseudouridine(38-40) synthase TruA [Erysipelotrichaceae bacterium]|jgi:tRNA pseudouridine38-40 synthase|nr:tRNA pseudouridine(38-40) synthase TruA [Erysipelotrichaceae bacterium]MBQ1347116.1 tRNA pseudouridine(38-40) synthase TruA [Erysipelotrichaceae bacterium]MBQ1379638.1 tRNA pseudouridine(38-40) synthase TruA [Erysipelotrichaceae bacterium]MBQ1776342.1 tRNA pseudouridine(38-40) synthase TruA [Erysipelotrichaceae bacterium]MBQ1811214.1 tRNA pseudouridine(38-40) synthase TruA [Erysipelotrichaceae bacterium]